MRRAVRFTWLSIVLLVFLLPGFAWGQYVGVPGPGPIAPAPDFPAYSAPSEEQPEPQPPPNHLGEIWKAKQEAASGISVPPGNVWIDPGGSDDAFTLRASFSGIDKDQTTPMPEPDPTIAVGPTNLVLSSSAYVVITDKLGTRLASVYLNQFFDPVRVKDPTLTISDPRVVFDPWSNRFFLVASGVVFNPTCTPGTCLSYFFLAVSKNSNPATLGPGDWYFYAFDATLDGATPTTNWVEFSNLGVDENVVVLTGLMLSFKDAPQQLSLQYAKVRILDKSKLIRGEAVTWTDFFRMTNYFGYPVAILQPAIPFGSPGTFFLLEPLGCWFTVWGITNPLSSPRLSALTARVGGTCNPPTGPPPDAVQPGGGTPLYTGGGGLESSVVYRNGSLWAAQTIAMNFGSGDVTAIRWVQIDVSAWPNSIKFIQESTFGKDGIWYFLPAIMVDAANNTVIVFARSSASEFASVYYTGRLATDPPNTLRPSALLKAGTANLNMVDSTVKQNRYGGYFGIALDPTDESFWMLGEYAKASDAWGTWVGNIVAPVGIKAAFESPEDGPVSGVAVIRGWAFATQPGVSIDKVELFIDGVSAGDIPCCSDRADVQAAFPQFPAQNTLNSGWGTTFNWGVLNAGSHTVQVVIKNTLGETLATETRTVTVVKPGNFEFLDRFSFSAATARIEGDQLVVEGVVARDKASLQQKQITARFRWFTSSQSLQTVEAVTTAIISPSSPRCLPFCLHGSWDCQRPPVLRLHRASYAHLRVQK